MKSLRNLTLIIFPIFLLAPIKGTGQNIPPKDTVNIRLINAAKEIMTSARYCALITLDDEGRPRVRVMDPFIPENDLTVWFGTNPKSRKVGQIANDPRGTLYYLDKDASGYVMIHGTAEIVNDPKEKEAHWKDEWKAFYPDYPEGYLLVKVTPEWMEVVSYTRNITGDSITWEPPTVYFHSNE
ncbi:MAG: pyridoxamine 5'-phosphate oxidase family protein [Saprospiraceae bacterium]